MLSAECVIRNMREDDLEAVAGVADECFSCPWSIDDYRFSVQEEYDIGLVAVVDMTVAGFCIIRTSFETADVIDVAVASSYRRLGIGRELMNEVMRLGREQGVTTYNLEVRAGNDAAIALYRNMGFEEIGVRRDYYSSPKEDALIMVCYCH